MSPHCFVSFPSRVLVSRERLNYKEAPGDRHSLCSHAGVDSEGLRAVAAHFKSAAADPQSLEFAEWEQPETRDQESRIGVVIRSKNCRVGRICNPAIGTIE